MFGLQVSGAVLAETDDLLSSWHEGKSKQSIIEFVNKVTDKNSPEFVIPAERIAVFDNDGTLWAEQPMYAQLFFALDRIKTMASEYPQWQDKEPFASVLKGARLVSFGAPGRQRVSFGA